MGPGRCGPKLDSMAAGCHWLCVIALIATVQLCAVTADESPAVVEGDVLLDVGGGMGKKVPLKVALKTKLHKITAKNQQEYLYHSKELAKADVRGKKAIQISKELVGLRKRLKNEKKAEKKTKAAEKRDKELMVKKRQVAINDRARARMIATELSQKKKKAVNMATFKALSKSKEKLGKATRKAKKADAATVKKTKEKVKKADTQKKKAAKALNAAVK